MMGGGGRNVHCTFNCPIALVNFFLVISKCVAHVSDTSIYTPSDLDISLGTLALSVRNNMV